MERSARLNMDRSVTPTIPFKDEKDYRTGFKNKYSKTQVQLTAT